MSTAHTRRDLNVAKQVHRFGHAIADEMKKIMSRTVLDRAKISEACESLYDVCPICAATGRPAMRKKVSTSHINEAFNK